MDGDSSAFDNIPVFGDIGNSLDYSTIGTKRYTGAARVRKLPSANKSPALDQNDMKSEQEMDGSSSPFDKMLHNIGNSLDYSRIDTLRRTDVAKVRKLIRANRSPAVDQNDMKSEQERLETFANWPNSEAISPSDLAKAGFYYSSRGDKVQCAFCKNVLRNWEAGDDAMIEHRRHFPRCLFVQGQDVGNIKIKTEVREKTKPMKTVLNSDTRKGNKI